MANTYTSLHFHIVYSTKNREPWIESSIERRVWEYLGGIEDHVHLVLGIPPKLSVSRAVQLLKGGSSIWIHKTFPNLARFEWQDGYGAFSISKLQLPEVIEYVKNQREHHRVRGFKEEYREFLEKHGIDYDERYVWG